VFAEEGLEGGEQFGHVEAAIGIHVPLGLLQETVLQHP
jgi:hypothetical protein